MRTRILQWTEGRTATCPSAPSETSAEAARSMVESRMPKHVEELMTDDGSRTRTTYHRRRQNSPGPGGHARRSSKDNDTSRTTSTPISADTVTCRAEAEIRIAEFLLRIHENCPTGYLRLSVPRRLRERRRDCVARRCPSAIIGFPSTLEITRDEAAVRFGKCASDNFGGSTARRHRFRSPHGGVALRAAHCPGSSRLPDGWGDCHAASKLATASSNR